MIIDCDTCTARGAHCSDCVVTCLLGAPRVDLDQAERRALAVLADGGLVPPLRMVPVLTAEQLALSVAAEQPGSPQPGSPDRRVG